MLLKELIPVVVVSVVRVKQWQGHIITTGIVAVINNAYNAPLGVPVFYLISPCMLSKCQGLRTHGPMHYRKVHEFLNTQAGDVLYLQSTIPQSLISLLMLEQSHITGCNHSETLCRHVHWTINKK